MKDSVFSRTVNFYGTNSRENAFLKNLILVQVQLISIHLVLITSISLTSSLCYSVNLYPEWLLGFVLGDLSAKENMRT